MSLEIPPDRSKEGNQQRKTSTTITITSTNADTRVIPIRTPLAKGEDHQDRTPNGYDWRDDVNLALELVRIWMSKEVTGAYDKWYSGKKMDGSSADLIGD